MIKFYSDNKAYRLVEIIVLLVVFAQVLIFLAPAFLLLFVILLASILALALCGYHCNKFEIAENKRRAELYEKRLLLLRRLIDHSYTYKYDKALFYKKFCDEIHIARFRKEHLINHGEIIKTIDISDCAPSARKIDEMSTEDYEFICLINEGFTPRELSVMFGLSHPQSIYVKRHRVRSRLERQNKTA